MTPTEVIATVPRFRGVHPGALSIAPLRGLTNRSFRISIGSDSFVLRLPGTGTGQYLDRRREGHNTRVAADLGIAPEIVWESPERGLMLTRYIENTCSLTSSGVRDGPALTVALGLIRKLHESGVSFQGSISALHEFDRYVELADSLGSAHAATLKALRRDSGSVRRALRRTTADEAMKPCHVDPVPANFISDGAQLWLVDWEYSAMADPLWDLACLALEANISAQQQRQILHGYFTSTTHEIECRFHDQLIAVSVVGLAWTAMRIAQSDAPAELESDYQARHRKLVDLLASVSA